MCPFVSQLVTKIVSRVSSMQEIRVPSCPFVVSFPDTYSQTNKTQRTLLEAPFVAATASLALRARRRRRCRDRCNDCGFVAPVFEDNFFHEETVGSVRVSKTKNVAVAPVNVRRHSHLFLTAAQLQTQTAQTQTAQLQSKTQRLRKKLRRKKHQWTTRTFFLLATIASFVALVTGPERIRSQLLQTVVTPSGDEFKIYAVKCMSSDDDTNNLSSSMCHLCVYGPQRISIINCYPILPDQGGAGTLCGSFLVPKAKLKHLRFSFKSSYFGEHHLLVERSYPSAVMLFYDEKYCSINCGMNRRHCPPTGDSFWIPSEHCVMMHRLFDAAFGNHQQTFRMINCQSQWHGNEQLKTDAPHENRNQRTKRKPEPRN